MTRVPESTQTKYSETIKLKTMTTGLNMTKSLIGTIVSASVSVLFTIIGGFVANALLIVFWLDDKIETNSLKVDNSVVQNTARVDSMVFENTKRFEEIYKILIK